MGQKENLALLLELHSIMTGTKKELADILSQRKVEPDISLIYNSELGGKVSFGQKISATKYYTLGELLEPAIPARA